MRSSLTTALFAVTVTAVALLPTGTAVAAPAIGAVIQVSADPFTDTDAQHATEVEPDTFAAGSTVVAAFQVGRIFGGGSSDIGWATSTDNGTTWQNGTLPGLTVNQGGGTFSAASDASVAFDAKHNAWLIAALPIDNTGNAVGISVNRSTNGGTTWSNPVHAVGFDGKGYDKNWIVCDDSATSPHFGNCYIEADVTSSGNAEIMATSGDGGLTWGPQVRPSGSPSGLGGQPLVQPNGTVVVPYSSNGSSIRAFSSTNGGTSWSRSVLIARVTAHGEAGGLRDGAGLPSAEVDGSGKVFVAWQDCRFRSGCPANDIVFSTSTNGTTWSAVTRVPIDATTSTVDHFIPGIGVDHATSGATAKVGLYYYFYPQTNCTAATCQLEVGYVSSTNGGTSWSAPTTVAGPFGLSLIANSSQGRMVGDYISCSVLNGTGVALFAVGKNSATQAAFNEGMFTVTGGIPVTGGTNHARTSTSNPTTNSPTELIVRH